jgi:transcriptional regulator with XRE-family HTH domain
MKGGTIMDDVRTGVVRAAAFADFVHSSAARAGRDLTSPRGGGRAALAADTGMSPASVSRMLNGQTIPDARFMIPLAKAIDADVLDLFILAGLLPDDVAIGQPRPITTEQAAHNLGIRRPDQVTMFSKMVRAILETDDESGP